MSNRLTRVWHALLSSDVEQKSTIGHISTFLNQSQAHWFDRTSAIFAREGYIQNVIGYRSINEVSCAVGSLKWIVKNSNGDVLDNHKILELLDRPNPVEGRSAFFTKLSAYKMIDGNTFIESISNNPNQPPRELHILRPDLVDVKPGRGGIPHSFEYTMGNEKKVFPVDPVTGKSQILQIKSFHPLSQWRGTSPLEAAAYSIDIHNEASNWNKSMLQNGARPSGVLTTDKSLTKEQIEQLKETMLEQYSGTDNVGRDMVFGNGLTYSQASLSPKDMDFMNGKHSAARDIALAIGVPPMLLGIPGDNTYSNYKEAKLALWQNTILLEADLIRDELNNWLTPQFGSDIKLDYDKDSIEALAPIRALKWERVKDADYLTINEKRQEVGYKEIDGGDDIFVPSGSLPLSFDLESTLTNQPKQIVSDDLEYKILNDRSQRARQREFAIQLRLQVAFEKMFTPKMARLLNRQSNNIAKLYQSDQAISDQQFKLQKTQLTDLLVPMYTLVVNKFGKRVLDGIKSDSQYDTKDTHDLFDDAVKSWIELHAAERATLINDSTRSLIKDVIDSGVSDGISSDQIARNIVTQTGKSVSKTRAVMIARTEVHAASTAGSVAAADATGLDLKKVWLTAQDERVRVTHVEANGQKRGKGEMFDIGGSQLMQPGDPNGPPSETINCRCVLTFESD